jgi:hypothetical protein
MNMMSMSLGMVVPVMMITPQFGREPAMVV